MIQKQNLSINFAQGLDTKTDPYQVPIGKMLELQNSIFTTGGLLQKRNGYGSLADLPDDTFTYLSTFSGSLTAIGASIQAYSPGSSSPWVNKGNFQPLSLSVLPLVRSALNQTQCDSVISSNNLVCTVYTEVNNGTAAYKYTIQDSVTGQNIVNPKVIPVTSGVVTGSPRVFLLGGYFIIVFTNVITAVSHLQYIAISISNPSMATANDDIAPAYDPATTLSWDGVVYENKLFIAYNTSAGGQSVKITYLTPSLIVATPQTFSGSIATVMSICVDQTAPTHPAIYASFYDLASTSGFVVAVDQNLNKLMTATQVISTGTVPAMTCAAQSGIVTTAYELTNNYSYDSAIPTHLVKKISVTLPMTVTTGTVGSLTVLARSVGVASKAFIVSGTEYLLTAYQSSLQSTYFLLDFSGNVVSRFAYENGGGYLTTGLPQAQIIGTTVSIAYLFKDLISTTAPVLSSSIGTPTVTNIYSQDGVNLVYIDFSSATLSVSEMGANLNLSGGMMWAYDGQTINEQGFNLFPDNVEVASSGTSGAMTAQQYFYSVTYQWTDSQGNIIQSAPSVPVTVTLSSGTSVDINIPTIRLTYKTGVKIMIFRWSAANQIYYQVTSITAPTLNNPAVDSIAYNDGLADSSIVGNSILYTTGGVIENIPAPAATATTLFDDRLWLIDAEDQNLLWFSKQVIEATPVEMSDLFTTFVAPSTGAQGSTGKLKCLFPMDDKIILFKNDAMYYINGTGPDNTGANSQYSQPIFINSTVGCSNQRSIVFMPSGLMFQSDKGIWLLGRDLSTTYIGAPVEQFNQYTVNSAQNIPGANQVRFTLSNGVTLMYDYFYQQWGTFIGVPAVSSTLYQGLHTFIGPTGGVAQETPGKYLDNTEPVLLGFKTSWVNTAGLQGFQRAYFFYLLGTYLSPHKLNVQIAYDYNSSPSQSTLISPNNFSSSVPSPYGTPPAPFGSEGNIESWRIFFTKQRCTSFQLSISEIYDPSMGAAAGKGLTMSGLNLVVAVKKGWQTQSAATSMGGGTNST